MSKKKVVITVDKGVIHCVQTDIFDLEVVVLDFDSDGADEDELISEQEAIDIAGDLNMIDYDLFIVN